MTEQRAAFREPFFARFVASLDTPGAHMLICLTVICLGAAFYALRIPKGEDLIVAGAATLFQAMRGKGAENHDTRAPQRGPRIDGGGESSSSTEVVTVQKSETKQGETIPKEI